jgi:hypothetical protein
MTTQPPPSVAFSTIYSSCCQSDCVRRDWDLYGHVGWRDQTPCPILFILFKDEPYGVGYEVVKVKERTVGMNRSYSDWINVRLSFHLYRFNLSLY